MSVRKISIVVRHKYNQAGFIAANSVLELISAIPKLALYAQNYLLV